MPHSKNSLNPTTLANAYERDLNRLRIIVADNLDHSSGLGGIIDLLTDLAVAFATTDQFSERSTAVLIDLIRDRLITIRDTLENSIDLLA